MKFFALLLTLLSVAVAAFPFSAEKPQNVTSFPTLPDRFTFSAHFIERRRSQRAVGDEADEYLNQTALAEEVEGGVQWDLMTSVQYWAVAFPEKLVKQQMLSIRFRATNPDTFPKERVYIYDYRTGYGYEITKPDRRCRPFNIPAISKYDDMGQMMRAYIDDNTVYTTTTYRDEVVQLAIPRYIEGYFF